MKKLSLLIFFMSFLSVQIFAQETSIKDSKLDKGIIADLYVPIAIAAVGAFWTIRQSKIQTANTRAEVFNHFQGKFKEFQGKLPTWINQRTKSEVLIGRPKDKKEKEELDRTIESYWWLVFDEWVVCCKEAKYSCQGLWNKYYSKGIQNALDPEREYFEEALLRLVRKKNSFMGHDDEFLDEIKKLYKEKYGIELFSTIHETGE